MTYKLFIRTLIDLSDNRYLNYETHNLFNSLFQLTDKGVKDEIRCFELSE